MQEREELDRLRGESAAGEGTFLVNLRGDRIEWDRAAFSRLDEAMRWAAKGVSRMRAAVRSRTQSAGHTGGAGR